jgi:excinuclease UvrABC nuclease subunit
MNLFREILLQNGEQPRLLIVKLAPFMHILQIIQSESQRFASTPGRASQGKGA